MRDTPGRLFLALMEGETPQTASPLVVSEDRRLVRGFLRAMVDVVGFEPFAGAFVDHLGMGDDDEEPCPAMSTPAGGMTDADD